MSKYKQIMEIDDKNGYISDMDGDYETKWAVFLDKGYQRIQADLRAVIR